MGLESNQPANQPSSISEGSFSQATELNQNVAMAIAGPAMPEREHQGYLNQVNCNLMTLKIFLIVWILNRVVCSRKCDLRF